MCGCGTVDTFVEYSFLLVHVTYISLQRVVGDDQVRIEAEVMLATATEGRNKEALAVPLATQLSLRTQQQVCFVLSLVFVKYYPTAIYIYIYIIGWI